MLGKQESVERNRGRTNLARRTHERDVHQSSLKHNKVAAFE